MTQAELTREDQDARFWFVEGECDAITLKPPKHPNNRWYMSGFHDAKYEISLGRICWRWNEKNEFEPIEDEGKL
jgi:hypothetical protein